MLLLLFCRRIFLRLFFIRLHSFYLLLLFSFVTCCCCFCHFSSFRSFFLVLVLRQLPLLFLPLLLIIAHSLLLVDSPTIYSVFFASARARTFFCCCCLDVTKKNWNFCRRKTEKKNKKIIIFEFFGVVVLWKTRDLLLDWTFWGDATQKIQINVPKSTTIRAGTTSISVRYYRYGRRIGKSISLLEHRLILQLVDFIISVNLNKSTKSNF